MFLSCDGPSPDDVRRDFLKQYPHAEIIAINPGEGDGSAVYMHIKYRLPGIEKTQEDVWQYLDKGGSQWELSNKQTSID